jgi:hypothetical protein
MTVRRVKTYAGTQGYVYQYYFVGSRRALPGSGQAEAIEYIFDVTSDRKTTFAVSLFLRAEGLNAWAASHCRQLSEAECYAVVKLRLFRAFDEIENMLQDGRQLVVDEQELARGLEALGLE